MVPLIRIQVGAGIADSQLRLWLKLPKVPSPELARLLKIVTKCSFGVQNTSVLSFNNVLWWVNFPLATQWRHLLIKECFGPVHLDLETPHTFVFFNFNDFRHCLNGPFLQSDRVYRIGFLVLSLPFSK